MEQRGLRAYEEYAPYYDGSGQLRFALLVDQYLAELLQRHPPPGQRTLDLACGTGTLAILLAERGWPVIGLDASPAMLAQARAKAETLAPGADVQFLHGDMRTLAPEILPGSCDLVTCTYDSLNYLLDDADLQRCFAAVAGALAPGGLWVFDLNTPYFLEYEWGTCEVVEQPGLVQLSRSQFDSATGCSNMVLTGFVGDDEQGYQRFDELHVERGYAAAQVTAWLGQAGFQVEGCYDAFTFQPPGPRAQRIFWVCRRLAATDRASQQPARQL